MLPAPSIANTKAMAANLEDERDVRESGRAIFGEVSAGAGIRQNGCRQQRLTSYVNRCPIFSFFVLRYSSACGLGVTSHGTRSATRTPARSNASTLSGLFESRRTLRTPSALRISAGKVKSR